MHSWYLYKVLYLSYGYSLFVQRASLVTFSELIMESMAKTVSNSGSKAVDSTSALTQDPDSGQDKEQDSDFTDGDDGESQDTPSRIWVQTDFWEYIDLLLVTVSFLLTPQTSPRHSSLRLPRTPPHSIVLVSPSPPSPKPSSRPYPHDLTLRINTFPPYSLPHTSSDTPEHQTP